MHLKFFVWLAGHTVGAQLMVAVVVAIICVINIPRTPTGSPSASTRTHAKSASLELFSWARLWEELEAKRPRGGRCPAPCADAGVRAGPPMAGFPCRKPFKRNKVVPLSEPGGGIRGQL